MLAPYVIPYGLVAFVLSSTGAVGNGAQLHVKQFDSRSRLTAIQLDERNKDRYDEPETQNPYGSSPHGPDPQGSNPHDEQHDRNMPANDPDRYLN
jgi:hypothetical protein